MRIGRVGSVGILCMALAGCLFVAGLVASSAAAKKAKTDVGLEVEFGPTVYFTYTVKVTSSKAKCEVNRKVTIYHDENGNQQLDPGEYIIGKGLTDEDGILQLTTTAYPPTGDGLGVLVKKTKKCKAGEFWEEVPDPAS